ncbi:ribonuclease P protein component [Aestuariibius sp. 2305UL40-4]|uniref:ribonuclease P protein component n=1 Tax=Aestuariibius violaceus TaxID=3234132 RepID=UPI00345EDDCE
MAHGTRIDRLLKRRDFLALNRSVRVPTKGFLLLAKEQRPDGAIRVGFTCSKKLGNAVARNRAKRRLRAVARKLLPDLGQSGWDYVLVGRPGSTVNMPFAELEADLRSALTKVHGS